MKHSYKTLGDRKPFQSVCKCGWVGEERQDYTSAKNDGYRHVAHSTSERPWKIGHEWTQIVDAHGHLIGTMADAGDATLVVDAINALATAEQPAFAAGGPFEVNASDDMSIVWVGTAAGKGASENLDEKLRAALAEHAGKWTPGVVAIEPWPSGLELANRANEAAIRARLAVRARLEQVAADRIDAKEREALARELTSLVLEEVAR